MDIKQIMQNNPDGFSILINDNKGQLMLIHKGDYKYGHLISITNNKGVSLENIEPLFNRLLKAVNVLSYNGDIFIGGWKDEDGYFYLDISLRVTGDAVLIKQFKNLFNQQATFNLKTWSVE